VRELQATLEIPPFTILDNPHGLLHLERFKSFFLSENRIVVEWNKNIHVWNKAENDGDRWSLSDSIDLRSAHAARAPRPSCLLSDWCPKNEEQILAAWQDASHASDHSLTFHSLPISEDGSVMVLPDPLFTVENAALCKIGGVCGKWLVFMANVGMERGSFKCNIGLKQMGLFVYNLDTNTRSQYILTDTWIHNSQKISSIEQSSECSKTFIVEIGDLGGATNDSARLLYLDDVSGQIFVGGSIYVGATGAHHPAYLPSIVGASKSHIFLASLSPPYHNIFSVSAYRYNWDPRTHERALRMRQQRPRIAPWSAVKDPAISCGAIAKARNELLLANVHDVIEVFCLDEPLL